MISLRTMERGARVLRDLVVRIRPWAEAHQAVERAVGQSISYLGGDGLRPYFVISECDLVAIVSIENRKLPPPLLIREIVSGTFGPATTITGSDGLVLRKLPRTAALESRLSVPTTLLVNLANPERYSSARLSLGVARLAQWLRFTHAATVTALDLSMSTSRDRKFNTAPPFSPHDVLGISVNFGQWGPLEALLEALRPDAARLIVLGNILPAFTPGTALELIETTGIPGAVATSLGERPLEQLCRQLNAPDSWHKIPGIYTQRTTHDSRSRSRPMPPELVSPDDALVAEVVAHGGLVAFETSFGCQYGKCSFCPRDHRGPGWVRGDIQVATAIIRRLGTSVGALSIVDEDFFGSEGLEDPSPEPLGAQTIADVCRHAGVSYEIYTRVEQLFDRRRSKLWNLRRAELLAREAPTWTRVFVGVESGVDSQLRRYGKGQTVSQVADALRVGSFMGVSLEFGFITFDPLLTPDELIANVRFLASADLLSDAGDLDLAARLHAVDEYLDGGTLPSSGTPLYRRVSYMATELEVLHGGRYSEMLQERHHDLLTGDYDTNFARYSTRYLYPAIDQIAGWCRTWTEAAFAPIYLARLQVRNGGSPAANAQELVLTYREVTFSLLVDLCRTLLPQSLADCLDDLPSLASGQALSPPELLQLASERVFSTSIQFDPADLHRRRRS